jgi:hypothetical protein
MVIYMIDLRIGGLETHHNFLVIGANKSSSTMMVGDSQVGVQEQYYNRERRETNRGQRKKKKEKRKPFLRTQGRNRTRGKVPGTAYSNRCEKKDKFYDGYTPEEREKQRKIEKRRVERGKVKDERRGIDVDKFIRRLVWCTKTSKIL